MFLPTIGDAVNIATQIIYFCRVYSNGKSVSYTQVLISSPPGSTWNTIYKNHMDENSYGSVWDLMPKMIHSEEKMTIFSSLAYLLFTSPDPCSVKIAWKSKGGFLETFAFPKNSSILPFFKKAYIKMRETGTWSQINLHWRLKKAIDCKSADFEPVSIYQNASLIVLLIGGIIFAAFSIIFEIIFMMISKKSIQLSIWRCMCELKKQSIVIFQNLQMK